MRQGIQHSKKLFLNQKYIYEILIGSCEKDKGFLFAVSFFLFMLLSN